MLYISFWRFKVGLTQYYLLLLSKGEKTCTKTCHLLPATCHLPPTTCHLPPATYHLPHATCQSNIIDSPWLAKKHSSKSNSQTSVQLHVWHLSFSFNGVDPKRFTLLTLAWAVFRGGCYVHVELTFKLVMYDFALFDNAISRFIYFAHLFYAFFAYFYHLS